MLVIYCKKSLTAPSWLVYLPMDISRCWSFKNYFWRKSGFPQNKEIQESLLFWCLDLHKNFTILIYDSRVVLTRKLPTLRLWIVIYACKFFKTSIAGVHFRASRCSGAGPTPPTARTTTASCPRQRWPGMRCSPTLRTSSDSPEIRFTRSPNYKIKLRYTGLERSDWMESIERPIRALHTSLA